MNLFTFMEFSLFLYVNKNIIPAGCTVKCFDCRGLNGATCNNGQCEGARCLKVTYHAVNPQNNLVQKMCDAEVDLPAARCTTQEMAPGQEHTVCYCQADWCNGEEQLVASGLQSSGAATATEITAPRSKRTGGDKDSSLFDNLTPNHVVMLIFLCLFVAGSFSLLIVNTVCIHMC